jgi:LmbE family N-acetylglucosaminyl deacetylase
VPGRRVLATILAHPDDETFGVGGTLLRYTDAGVECHSLSLTRGEASTNMPASGPVPPAELGRLREAELAESGRRLGLRSTTCLGYPDGRLAAAPAAEVLRDLVRWLRTVRPDVVLTWGPDGGYGHPDHIASGQLALRAVELAGVARHAPELGEHVHVRRCYRMVATAEVFDALAADDPEFIAYLATLPHAPRRWTRADLGACIDIRAVAERKWHAMRAHETQRADLVRLERLRDRIPFAAREEAYLRAFPDPGGPPLETDLFSGVDAG